MLPKDAFRLIWNAKWVDLPASKLIRLLGESEATKLGIMRGDYRPRTAKVPVTTQSVEGGVDRGARMALAAAARIIESKSCGPPNTINLTGWDRRTLESGHPEERLEAFRFFFRTWEDPIPGLIVAIIYREGVEPEYHWVRPDPYWAHFDTPVEDARWVKLTVPQLRQMVEVGLITHHGTITTIRNGVSGRFQEYLLEVYTLNEELVTVERMRQSDYDSWADPTNPPTDGDILAERNEGWDFIPGFTPLIQYPYGAGITLNDQPVRRTVRDWVTSGEGFEEKLQFSISPGKEGIPLNDPTALKQALPDGWFTPA